MIDLQDFIESNQQTNVAEDVRARENQKQLDETEKEIVKILDDNIKNNYKLLPEFAFQLRCLDKDDDYYTMKFL